MKTVTALAFFAFFLTGGAQAQENSYLEIPLEGRFGDQITARGVEDALKTAECLGAKHIVLTLNSPGGDQLVARDVYNVLSRYDKKMQFHALVREATGVAVVPLVWCETILVRPGGKIGGVNLVIDDSRYPGIESSVVLQNLALNAGEEARRHGRSAELVQAMIDPSQAVNGWRDSAGRVQISHGVPNGVHSDDFILRHAPGSVLTLTDREAVELRFARAYDGDAAGLGRELGFPGWIAMGGAGRAAMTDATVAEQVKTAAARSDRQQFLIDQNHRRRMATKASIERFLKLAHEWHPTLGTYSTYKETHHWWDNYGDGCGSDTGRLTPEARQKWKDRTDITVAALSKARGGVLEMKYLEKEARELGQEMLFPEGKLEEMRLDLELKIALLLREREKRFKDEK
jgi:hypothetical protein